MYDWANSAFATTILAAVLPIYYSQVAGATLPSEATATAYWSVGLSLSLFIVAILSPILGTISDVMRGKKRFLTAFAAIGIVATGLFVLVDTGDWLLASILFVLARIGFTGANVFYDALLPHVAAPEDQDRVSTRGYAMGYLGGGLLLAINVAMIQFLPGTWGPRLSFLSVAIWWAVFSIPLLLRVPEPPAATATLAPGENVVSVSFKRLAATIKDIRRYRELFKYLVAFLIYNDGIGTIIGVAAIYGAELGFGSIELILALLLVQFVGIPFSLVFGRLAQQRRRAPPAVPGLRRVQPRLPAAGGHHRRADAARRTDRRAAATLHRHRDRRRRRRLSGRRCRYPVRGRVGTSSVSADVLRTDEDVVYASTSEAGARYDFAFNGQEIEMIYSVGPDHGIWAVEMDGASLLDADTGQPMLIDGYNATVRYGARKTLTADAPGEHTLAWSTPATHIPTARARRCRWRRSKCSRRSAKSNLGAIIGMIVGVEILGAAFAFAARPPAVHQTR